MCVVKTTRNTFKYTVWASVAFLGAFAKLRKTAVSFVMSLSPSVRPSVCMSVRPHETNLVPLGGFS